MPSYRILLLLRRATEFEFQTLREQVAALRNCFGVTDVIIGVHDARGVRLLSPWLFLPPGMLPDGMDGAAPDSSLPSKLGGLQSSDLAAAIVHALVANPLAIRDTKSLRNSFARIGLADPSQWTTVEREGLAADLPLLELPTTIGRGNFGISGRIREPGVGGPLRILALNLVEPTAQALLGRFVYDLGRQRRLVELLDHREPTPATPMFLDGMHVRQLNPQQTDQSADTWHLVMMGRQLPFSVRQFKALTARLVLFARPTMLIADHRPVAVSLDAAKLTFNLTEQAGSPHYALAQTTAHWSLRTLNNAHLCADNGRPPKPPLAAWLALARNLQDGSSNLSMLTLADRFRDRFGISATTDDLMAARMLAHRGYEPYLDPWVMMSLAADLGQLLAIERQDHLRRAVFLRFLRRPPESDSNSDAPVSLRKRIEIIRGVVGSNEYTCIVPRAAAAATRGLVDRLHEAIVSGRSLREAREPAAKQDDVAQWALTKACLALAAHRLECGHDLRTC